MKLKIPPTLTQQAYQRIRDGILSGSLTNGNRLTEDYLARALGISKSPVREAMNRLESEGLIEIQPRRGAFIRNFTPQDVDELYDLREALECHLVRNLKLTPAARKQLDNSVRKASVALEHGNRRQYISMDMAFHGILARCSGNARLRQVLDNMYGQLLVLRLHTYKLTGHNSPRQHRLILQALSQGDNSLAEKRMAEHIREVRLRLLDFMRERKTENPPPSNSRNAAAKTTPAARMRSEKLPRARRRTVLSPTARFS